MEKERGCHCVGVDEVYAYKKGDTYVHYKRWGNYYMESTNYVLP
jgi:hypothetical protein